MRNMKVGLLGLQGAFRDHISHLEALGVSWKIVRTAHELKEIDRLIIPGGESTVMEKFLVEFNLLSLMRKRIKDGMPVWGICAGAIILSEKIDNCPGPVRALYVSIKRNAYGRHFASKQTMINVPIMNRKAFPAIFIRAPQITDVKSSVNIHACLEGDPVFIQQKNIMATTFHPELTDDSVFHRYFLDATG